MITLRKIATSAALAIAPALGTAQAVQPAPPDSAVTDAARLAAANHLLDLTHLEQQYDRIFAQMVPAATASMVTALKDNQKVPAAMRQTLTGPEGQRIFTDEVVKGFRASYPAFRKMTAAEYAKSFTLQKLQQIAAFYESVAGQKALSVAPAIQSKLIATGMAAGQEIGRRAMTRTIDRLQLAPPAPKT